MSVLQEEPMSFGLVFASEINYWNGMSACLILLLRRGSSRECFWDSNTLASSTGLREVALSSLHGRTGAKQPEKKGISIKKKSLLRKLSRSGPSDCVKKFSTQSAFQSFKRNLRTPETY